MWWRYFERLEMPTEELWEDPDCLAACERTGKSFAQRSGDGAKRFFEFQYDITQEFRNLRFRKVYVRGFGKERDIYELDVERGTLRLSLPTLDAPWTADLIINEYVSSQPIVSAIRQVGEQWLAQRELHKPLMDFLLRKPPDVDPELLRQIDQASDDRKLHLIIRAIAGMNQTVLSIQGPPGTGKTYTAAHAIRYLLRNRKKIGITSNSHKAIDNLLKATIDLCEENGEHFHYARVAGNPDERMSHYTTIKWIGSNTNIWTGLEGDSRVIGATAWGFSREGGIVDYLFIDEAGQVSLANLVAMSGQAQNIVCLGDQMQLPQPIEGSHPEDSGCSILDYLLKDEPTISVEKGILLNRSYRMHRSISRFISDAIYQGRLVNDPNCDNQSVLLSSESRKWLSKGTGIHYIELDHTGNLQVSFEEVDLIESLIGTLAGSYWIDKHRQRRRLTSEDILVVAPFNHQVNELKRRLGDSARVGTVDIFQGQEAPVVIVSMTTSIAAEHSRGSKFVLSRNRLNVAVSRAQCLAVVVASSKLLELAPRSLEEMRLYNLVCRLKFSREV